MGLDDVTATAIYGLYTAAVYVVALPGGWIADRLLGLRRSVFWGGAVIAAGHFTLAIPNILAFYAGLSLIVIGTGLLKPNISAIVGDLYPEGGARRDAGFSIYYMGINIGGMMGPLICGYLGEVVDWHLGFGAAGVGMVLGLIQYSLGGRYLGTAGELRPEAQSRGGSQCGIPCVGARARSGGWDRSDSLGVANDGRHSTDAHRLRRFGRPLHRLARRRLPSLCRHLRRPDDGREKAHRRHRRVLPCRGVFLVGLRAGGLVDEPVCGAVDQSRHRRMGNAGKLAAVGQRPVHHSSRADLQCALDLAWVAKSVDSREDGVRTDFPWCGVRGTGVGLG